LKANEDNDVFYAGSEVAMRLDRPLYDYRDFVRARAFANAKLYVRPTLLSRMGYTLRYQEYVNARDFSFVEQVGFVQLSKFLPSRMTLQVRGELGLKNYLRDREPDDAFLESGRQSAVLQWVGQAKVAQSLTEAAGLQLSYTSRRNLTGQSRRVDEDFYDPDDELFDDRYSYESDEWRTALKYLAPQGAELEVVAGWDKRHYGGRPALDLEGNFIGSDVDRQDERRSLSLGLAKTFYMEWGLAQELNVQLDWTYRNTASNDPYYSASGQVFSSGIQIGF
jgi:hypothetical protein